MARAATANPAPAAKVRSIPCTRAARAAAPAAPPRPATWLRPTASGARGEAVEDGDQHGQAEGGAELLHHVDQAGGGPGVRWGHAGQAGGGQADERDAHAGADQEEAGQDLQVRGAGVQLGGQEQPQGRAAPSR